MINETVLAGECVSYDEGDVAGPGFAFVNGEMRCHNSGICKKTKNVLWVDYAQRKAGIWPFFCLSAVNNNFVS